MLAKNFLLVSLKAQARFIQTMHPHLNLLQDADHLPATGFSAHHFSTDTALYAFPAHRPCIAPG
jgi:hypothetical protein